MGHVACMGRGETCTGFVRKPEIKIPLGRHNYRWKHNIYMEFQEVGCECVQLIELSDDSDGCGIL